MDYAELKVIEALPHYFHPPSGDDEVFRRLAGATILRLGTTQEGGIEGGGLILDYALKGAKHRLVFGMSELGMWVVYDSFKGANPGESRKSPVGGLMGDR